MPMGLQSQTRFIKIKSKSSKKKVPAQESSWAFRSARLYSTGESSGIGLLSVKNKEEGVSDKSPSE